MPRRLRIDYEGAWHHVMNRGARRAPIFHRDDHCLRFLDLVGDACSQSGIEVHAYALMPNHYHLLVRSPRASLSRGMRHLGSSYTQYINRCHGWDGPLFRGRFRSQLLPEADRVMTVAAYIHLNPIRAGLAHRLDAHCWTSHRTYLGLDRGQPWLRTGSLLDEAGNRKRFGEFVRDYRIGRRAWPEELDVERGWFLDMDPGRTPWSRHAPSADETPSQAQDPETVLARVVRITGASRADLGRSVRGRLGNPAQRFAAWALARNTDLTQRAIGMRVDLSASRVGNILSEERRRHTPRLRAWVAAWLSQQDENE